MASFLKFVSTLYLLVVWGSVAIMFLAPLPSVGADTSKVIAVVLGLFATVPAAALFAFAQLVDDTRFIRMHLAAMHRYYEPGKL